MPQKKLIISKDKIKPINIDKDNKADKNGKDNVEEDDIDKDDIDKDDIEEEHIDKDDKNKLKQSIILKNTKINVPDLVIKETKESKEDNKEDYEIKKDKTVLVKKGKIEKKDEVINNDITEKSEKNKHHTKNKKLSASKNLESSFDMFGDDDVDYRFVMMNYDYTKNKTLPKITKYEKALLIGKRAKQIEDGANPNIKVMPGQGAIEIAEEELRQRKIPFIIKRPIGNTFEYWKPADMEVNMD